jgi:hypothetical protein
MKRKDAPQLFEIMRTTLSGKMSATPGKKEGGDASAAAAPPAGPSPVSPPLIVPPIAPVPEVEPVAPPSATATRPPGVESIPEREPPVAAAVAAPASVREPERAPAPPPEPEPPAPIATRPALPPPPLEPVFDVPPPKPRPRHKPRPFSLKPPAPSPREAGPEQRLSFSYRVSLAVAAFLFVLVFAAFAIGRTATPVRPPDAPPAHPPKPSPPMGEVHKMETPRTAPPRPVPPRPDPPAPPKPKWTIRLLEYDVTQPRDREDAIRLQVEPTQRKLREGFKAETRIIEWTRGGKTFLGLFYGQWDTPDQPDIATIEANLRNLEPFGKGRKPFEKTCKLMPEPSSS